VAPRVPGLSRADRLLCYEAHTCVVEHRPTVVRTGGMLTNVLQIQTATTFVSYLSTLAIYSQSGVLRSSTSDLLSTQSSLTNIAARRFSCCLEQSSLICTHCW